MTIPYAELHAIVFKADYPGYKPTVHEIPNGDGNVDADKRFAHVATKYLEQYKGSVEDVHALNRALVEAHILALQVADALDVPVGFDPVLQYGALRVLEYPAGAVSNLHTDPNLFTLVLYRDAPECFVAHDGYVQRGERLFWTGLRQDERLRRARKINAQLHIGEMGEMLGLGPATPHEVIACDRVTHSAVYFAIPEWSAVLPNGQTVKAFLDERLYKRGRVDTSRRNELEGKLIVGHLTNEELVELQAMPDYDVKTGERP